MGTPVDDRRVGATRLGSYEILRRLARGGMAEIFLARAVGPEGFEKLVVLKKILPQFAANPKFVKLFLDEARLAAGFDHPHIAHVYDMGTVDGHYFFTMEYVHGQDVRSVLRRTDKSNRQLPIDHAVQVARNVAAALHYAHERRRPDGTLLDIVHRDVSPSNIVVSYDGAVKLLDFGVAKAASSSVKTRTGTLKGKIAYMSPEQARGATIDRRSDIFSIGIVLWELVATRRLFKADNDLATIQLIINTEAPPVSVVRPDCPPELERIITRALAQDLGDRYQSAQELQLDLEELARENKLSQSSIALSRYMTEMFSAEIQAWLDAQASGITLTDHMIGDTGVAGTSALDLTTPVSEADIEDLSGEVPPDDEDDLPGIGLEGGKAARRPTAVPQELPKVTAPMRPVALNAAPQLQAVPGVTPGVTPIATVMPQRPASPSAAPPMTNPSASGVPVASVSGVSGASAVSGMSGMSGVSAPGSIGWSTGAQPSLSGSLSGSMPGLPRSRAPKILLAAVAVIAVGVGIGTIIARHGANAPATVEPAAAPTTALPPAPPPVTTPTTTTTAAEPAPAPAPAMAPSEPAKPAPVVAPPEPAPTGTQTPTQPDTQATTAPAKRKPKPKPRPAAPPPVKKPPLKFDPNAALPPE